MFSLKRCLIIALFLGLISWSLGLQPGWAQAEATFQQQVEQLTSQRQPSPAVAALLITPEGRQTAFSGQTGNPAQPTPTSNTLFEIGSITKVFTALLLADQAEQGEVALDTPIGELLPDNIERSSDIATLPLQSLASHRAGLPRLPLPRMLMGILYPANPYRGSQPAELYQALRNASPNQSTCEYSNLGPALLGQLLARQTGQSYENLVEIRVLAPLGLNDTHFTLEPEAIERLAQGHQENMLPTANWQLDAYAPAGGLKSTLSDMGQFLAAAMAADWPPLAISLQPDSEDCEPNFGLGWIFTELEDAPLVMHNGGTGGYYAFLGWLPEVGRGLVLLTNISDTQGDQVATALLTGEALPTRNLGAGSLILMLFLAGLLGYQAWYLLRSQPPSSWLKATEEVGETLFNLALAYQLGPWQWLPVALWWGLLILFVGLVLRRLRSLRALPPAATSSPSSRWRSLRLVPTLLMLGWTLFCLR
jgi:D-alanyl-D-alanine-carboxypeptidase/D-alanyl-D-alanine-endopeptidase